MIELTAAQFPRVIPLVQSSGMKSHLGIAYGAIEGRQPGRIFVDRVETPRSTLVCSLSGFYFAFGAPRGEEAAFVQSLRGQPLSPELTAIFTTVPAWIELLSSLFDDDREPRLGFEYHPQPGRPPENWRDLIPNEFSLQPITAPLAQTIVDGTGTGGYGIDPWFIRIAGGPERYAALGLGLALVNGGQVASISGVCGIGGGEVELEVGTTPAYRGLGLATLVTAAFMAQCFEKGWRPAYSCASGNLPSISVARKLGFVEVEAVMGFPLSRPAAETGEPEGAGA